MITPTSASGLLPQTMDLKPDSIRSSSADDNFPQSVTFLFWSEPLALGGSGEQALVNKSNWPMRPSALKRFTICRKYYSS